MGFLYRKYTAAERRKMVKHSLAYLEQNAGDKIEDPVILRRLLRLQHERILNLARHLEEAIDTSVKARSKMFAAFHSSKRRRR